MSGISLLAAAGRTTQAWKNGGGTTSEVVIYPPGSGYDDFDWRLSLADIRASGPFSRFNGVDRLLAVTYGTLRLAIADEAPVLLAEHDEPRAFSGDVAVHADPCGDAPVKDCNLMVRRAFGKGRMCWVGGRALLVTERRAVSMRLLLAPRGGALRCGAERVDLACGDAATIEYPGRIDLEGEQKMLFIEISNNV